VGVVTLADPDAKRNTTPQLFILYLQSPDKKVTMVQSYTRAKPAPELMPKVTSSRKGGGSAMSFRKELAAASA
jgi:hypothetical protein